MLLFGFGLLVGPVLQILQPASAFGGGLRPMVGLAVAIVVFEGGLALDFRELRAAGDGVFRLTVVALPNQLLARQAWRPTSSGACPGDPRCSMVRSPW